MNATRLRPLVTVGYVLALLLAILGLAAGWALWDQTADDTNVGVQLYIWGQGAAPFLISAAVILAGSFVASAVVPE